MTPIQQKTRFFPLFYEEINRTASEQMLKISTTFSKVRFHRNFVTSQWVVLFSNSLSGYALLNALWREANDFNIKWCLKTHPRSAPEYTMFALAQLLRNWCDRQPSNNGDLELSVTGEVGKYTASGWTCFSFHFCTAVRDCWWIMF
jgi:hypothetical protein